MTARSDWQSLLWLLSRDHKPLIYAVSRGASRSPNHAWDRPVAKIRLPLFSPPLLFLLLLVERIRKLVNFRPRSFFVSRWNRISPPREKEERSAGGGEEKENRYFRFGKRVQIIRDGDRRRGGEGSRVSKYSRLIQPNSRWIKTLLLASPRHDPGGISNSRPQYDQSPTARYPSSFSTPVELLDFKCLPVRAIAAHIDARTGFSTMTSCSLLILIKWQPCSARRRVPCSAIFVPRSLSLSPLPPSPIIPPIYNVTPL